MTPSPFTPAGLAISKIVAGIKPPKSEPQVPLTPREEDDEECPVCGEDMNGESECPWCEEEEA